MKDIRGVKLGGWKFKVGKEIPTIETLSEECPNCKGRLYPRNGSNSYCVFLDPSHPNASTNYWKCIKCRREFKAILK